MQKMGAHQKGFTIVELLIVIVVIGILAAITIVAFTGVQNRANDSAVTSDIKQLAKQIKLYEVENGDYPRGTTQMATIKPKVTKTAYSRGMYNGANWYNLVYCWPNAANPDVFSIVAQSKSGNVFAYRDGTVKQVAFVLTSSAQTCSSSGVLMDGGDNRDWLYYNDYWLSYVGP